MKAALPLLALTAVLAACAPAAKTPPPQARPVATPAASAPRPARPQPSATVPTAPATRWMDMPRTAGAWSYAASGSRSEAAFRTPSGSPVARLTCLAGNGTVVLSLPDGGAPRALVTVRTETASRSFEARPADRSMNVALAASDPLLDAMALSKGTFALEADGLTPLYLPSWAEVSRVIEDCR